MANSIKTDHSSEHKATIEKTVVLDRLENLYNLFTPFIVIIVLFRLIFFLGIVTSGISTMEDMVLLVIWICYLLTYFASYALMRMEYHRTALKTVIVVSIVDVFLTTSLYVDVFGIDMLFYLSVIAIAISIAFSLTDTIVSTGINGTALLVLSLIHPSINLLEVVLGPFLFYLLATLTFVLISQNQIALFSHKQHQIVEQERLFRSILENAGDAIIISDKTGNIILSNPKSSELTGYSTDELMKMKIGDLDTQGARSAEQRLQNEAMTHSQGGIVERTILSKEGREILVEINARRLSEDIFIGILRDLSERKLREDEQNKLLSAVEQSTSMIIITDPKGMIEYVNPTFIDKTGYQFEEVQGRNPRIINSAREPEERSNDILDYISQGKQWVGEFENQKKNGEIFWSHASISPVFDNEDNIINFICIQDDITEQRRIEEQLKESKEQLLQLQKMEAVGRLAGGVAHDFNNILTVMLGYSEFILSTMSTGDRYYDYVVEIHENAKRATELTGQLLTFSKKQFVKLVNLDPNDAIEETMTLLNRIIGEDIHISTEYSSPDTTFVIDKNQFEQIVLNLATNARDAMEEGGEFKITTRVRDQSRLPPDIQPRADMSRYIELSFKDTGSGIDPAIINDIFDPFFTTKSSGTGTGLGLSIVYGIVKQHNGFIKVRSEIGVGSEFILYFPVDEITMEVKSKSSKQDYPDLTNLNVLIVEDEEDVASLLDKALKMLNGNVYIAGDAEAAFELLHEHDFNIDMLITDLVLPGMDGYQFSMLAKEKNDAIKVLYISGYSSEALPEEMKKLQEMNFLSKPFTISTLHDKIDSIFNQH